MLRIHHGEHAGGHCELGLGGDIAAVPGTVLIEGILAIDEGLLHFLVAQGGSVGIDVFLQFDELVHGFDDAGLIPGGSAGVAVFQALGADGLHQQGLGVLGQAPVLLAGHAEGNNALFLQSLADGDQLVIGLRDLLAADFLQQVHIGEHGDHVHGQRHAVVLSFIGAVGQHGVGQLSLVFGQDIIQAQHAAGVDEVAQEGHGPGEEDVRQIGARGHGSLDLGLVGFIFGGFHGHFEVGVRGIEGIHGRQIGSAVGVTFHGDGPQGDGGLVSKGGADAEDHDGSQDQCKYLFHGNPPYRKLI